MKQSIMTLLAIFLCIELMAQQKLYKALSIGDRLPFISEDMMWADSSYTYDLTQIKDKLILLDFWNTSCTACIAAMPKMDSLQQLFADKIQIIYITQNTIQEVNKLFSKIKIKQPRIPMMVSDTIFNLLFPHQGDPHHVWINGDGKVQFITYGYNATIRNIKDFLEGKKLHFSLKREIGNFDPFQSFLSPTNLTAVSLCKQYSSLLLKGLQDHISTTPIIIKKDSVTSYPYSIRTLNSSLLTLYSLAFNKDIYGYDIDIFNLPLNNRILLEVKNSKTFTLPIEDEQKDTWKAENLFSYELNVPIEKANDFYQIMQQDMNRYFNYQASIEKRSIKCLALVLRDKSKLPVTARKTTPVVTFNEKGAFTMHSAPISPFFIRYLVYANQKLSMPIYR